MTGTLGRLACMVATRPRAEMAVAVVVVALGGLAAGWFPIQSTDLGHHVATGRWIWEHGHLPRADPFSWTAPGAPWFLYQWLPDALLAWVEQQGGLFALVGLRALVFALVAVAMLHAAKRRCGSVGAATGAVLLGIVLVQPRMLLRPMLFGTLALSVLDGLLTGLEERGGWRRRVLAHVLMTLWALVHPLFLLGFARWLQHLLLVWLRRGSAGREALLFALALASSFLGVAWAMPRGLNALWSVIWAGGHAYFAQLIVELQPFLRSQTATGLHLLGVALLVAGLSLAKERWRVRLTRYGLAAALLVGTLLRARLLDAWVVVTVPLLAEAVVCVRERLADRDKGLAEKMIRWGFPLYGAIVVLLALAQTPMGWGAQRASNLYPEEVKPHLVGSPPERLYHDLLFAGFLLWDLGDKVRPFIDGRLELYGPSFLRDPYRRVLSGGPRWDLVLDVMQVDAILLSTARSQRLHKALRHHPGWRLGFQGNYAIVYRRTGPPRHAHNRQGGRGET